MRGPSALGLAACLILGSAGASHGRDAVLRPADLGTSTGFRSDDLSAAFAAFRAGCAAPRPPLESACRAAASHPERLAPDDAATFFTTHFVAYSVDPPGLLTGYFEPEIDGALEPSAAFSAPLLAPPDPAPAPFPDRAAIEAGALGAAARPVVFLRDAVDAFTIHVQGSARVRLPDGTTLRVGFAGRNGHPYTALGRVLAERFGEPPASWDAGRVWSWLRAHPDEAAGVMAANRSFIFFRAWPALGPEAGPVGAAGLPLRNGRSVAVDATFWPYGLPVWLDGTLPDAAGRRSPLARLAVAQDTGAAIRGAARIDLFVGSGDEAGRIAGLARDPVAVTILWPRDAGPPPLPVAP